MVRPIPMNANEFIEQQLDERIQDLERTTRADVLGFVGDLIGGVDDLFRNVVEEKKSASRNRRKTSGAQDKLVVILTTAGGYIEIVQRIVDTLRHHYGIVEFVVPDHAYSAGTVFVMSGDAIWMDYYSRLGPIDPQVEKRDGRMVPALGYLKQWERLLEKAKQGEITLAEVQLMIQGFDQAELYQYEQQRQLSISLLVDWLAKYKFKNWTETQTRRVAVTEEMRKERTWQIANALCDTERWRVHGHGISMEVLRRDLNLIIDDFEDDARLSSKIRGYHSLLSDYMSKMGHAGVMHATGTYQPFMVRGI